MGRKLVFLAAGFGVLVLAANVALASGNVRFNRYSVEQGLSQSVPQAIVQDQQGFIWIGTQSGLNRFDGLSFTTYYHDPGDPQSLSHDWIWSLHVDSEGILWVGTASGLNRLDTRTGRISPVKPGADGLGEDEIRVIRGDGLGGLWLGSEGGGLVRFDPATGVIERWLPEADEPSSLSSDRVKTLLVDNGGFVWIGTDGGGLNRLDPVSGRIVSIGLPGNNERVRCMAQDPGGDIWVATTERGLYQLSARGELKFHYTQGDGSGLSSDAIRVLFVDREGSLWVGTDSDGVNVFAHGEGRFTQIRHQPAAHTSLNDDHIASIFQDQGGVIWIGTQVGINTWNPLAGAFSTFARHGDGVGELSNNWVSAFVEDAQGRLFVGTAGGGVDRVDLIDGSAVSIGPADGEGALSDPRVFALAVTADNLLWAGTRAGGINRFDARSGHWHTYRHDPQDPNSLAADGVSSLLVDADNKLWVGTFGGGLSVYNAELDRFEPVQSQCSDRVLSLYQDRSKAIWIGTYGEGLCRLDPQTGEVEIFRHDPDNKLSLSSDDAWTVVEDEAENLWVGTSDGGINVWLVEDRRDGIERFARMGVEEGLGSRVVFALQSDASGQVWASGTHGLSLLDLKTSRVRQFSVADGLSGNEFNFGASLREVDGRLLFGGVNGFTAFYPHQIGTNSHAPPVELTRFLRHNEPVDLDELRNDSGLVTLTHSDYLVTFEFAALDFADPQSNTYRHLLEGFDEDWMSDGDQHRLTYTNLQPGNYRLRVQAANADGVWNEVGLDLPFQVLAAPWATWWAKSIYLLAGLLVVFLIYRVQARKLAFAEEIRKINNTLVDEINENRRKEVALSRSERRAQRYLDVVEVIILALDYHGRVTMINQKGARALGYPEADIKGRNFYDSFVPVEVRDEVRQQFQNVEEYAYSESPIKPHEGAERLIAWHTIALPSAGGGPGGILISGADVTQMRSLERQLRDAQKMEALGTLARGVAHDFNNILSSILGYAELSLAEVVESPKAVEYLKKLEASVDRARDLVHGVLTFGRGSGEAPEPVRVADLVSEALQLLEPTLGANIAIETSLERDCGAVLADPTQLVQVVMNLCSNAGQAMSESGGLLRVEVVGVDVDIDQARSLTVLLPGPHVRLRISDNGPGMDDFTLARIFDPFFTTRRRDEGTGLGLAVVHGIVTQLKGAIEVTSEVGQGTEFVIYLPCCADEPLEKADEPQTSADDLSGTGTVLFVDDEPAVRAIVEEALSNFGYRVLTAEDGERAIELFDQLAGQVDMVITDQTMPGMLGHQLAERLREKRSDLPIILMSGAGNPDTSCVDLFVEKPFTLSALGLAVRSLLSADAE